MDQTSEIFNRCRHLFGTVPPQGHMMVCPVCLGPRSPSYSRCNSCEALSRGGAPEAILSRVVPLTTVCKPSNWYTFLWSYKATPRRDSQSSEAVLAALLQGYWLQHHRRIAELLGGEPDLWTVVPSKRGVSYSRQPLVRVLARVGGIRPRLAHALSFLGGAPWQRQSYRPALFAPGAQAVTDHRLVIVEDTWVTGATAVSAAGALLAHGARAVVLLVLARAFNEHHLSPDHPYFHNHRAPYDITVWPRTC